MIFLISLLSIFFALNMGGASLSASFSAAYGGKFLTRVQSSFLFVLFVILGSVLLGQNVSDTLSKDIIPVSLLTQKGIIVIFLSAGISMFVSNLMHIPQSTSLVTVAAIAGVGGYVGELNISTILRFIPFWVLLPILSYVITYYVAGYIYPPRRINFWIYQKLINQQQKLKTFVIICSCYNAFSVGTNNVANVVGPFVGSGSLSMMTALLLFGFIYGLGGFAFTGPIRTAGDKIVPLGLITASIISLVSGTLMIMASVYGMPQSFVMLQMGALFAVSSLKKGTLATFENPLTRNTLYTWTINPVITYFLSFGLSWLII